MPIITAVIPTYTRQDLLFRAIDSLLHQSIGRRNIQIIVVDNASPTNIRQNVLRRYGWKVEAIRLDKNYFFCGAINRGASLAAGRYLAIVNDDCWVEPTWAEAAAELFDGSPDVGAIASLVMKDGESNTIDSAGDHLEVSGRATNLRWRQPLSSVNLAVSEVFSAAGSCAVYRRDIFETVGGLDEDFIAYFDDVDLGFRIRLLGYSVVLEPRCRAHHLGGATYKHRSRAAFLMERNMIWNLVKNMPSDLLRSHASRILAAQSTPAPLYDGNYPTAWAKGKLAALLDLDRILAKRKRIQQRRRVSSRSLESLLLAGAVNQCHL